MPALAIFLVSALTLAGCNANAPSNSPATAQTSDSEPQATHDPAEVETMVSEYYAAIGAYDYAKMRSMYGPEWEIFDDGSRLDADGFEALVKGLQGRNMTWQFSIGRFDTEITGDRAYTNYEITNPPDRKWFGTAYSKHTADGWKFDHMVMMTERRPQAGQQQAGANAGQPAGNTAQQ
jgi:hypothetical protein